MIRATQMHCLLVGALAVAFALSPGDSAWADSHESTVKIFSVKAGDFEEIVTAFGSAAIAAPMAVPGMSGGIARLEKGKHGSDGWTHWYGEVVYIISGRARFTTTEAPLFTSSKTQDVGAGDFFFIPLSTRIGYEVLSDEPFVFFYAIPD